MASRGVNKVILVGNVGADPEIKYGPSGDAITNLTIATSETWRDKATGEQREKTEWHRTAIFGKLAEIAGEYVRKGSQIYIEGKLQTRKWQDQSGQDRYTTEVVVDSFNGVLQLLGGRQNQDQGQGQGHGQGQQWGQQQAPQQQAPQQQAPQQQAHQQQAPQQQAPQQQQQQQWNQPPQEPQQQPPQQQQQQWSQPSQAPQQQAHQQAHQQAQPQYNEPPMDFDDDIPF